MNFCDLCDRRRRIAVKREEERSRLTIPELRSIPFETIKNNLHQISLYIKSFYGIKE